MGPVLSAELPEKYALLYDYKTEKFETPLDDRGIANIDAIAELAIWTCPFELPDFYNTYHNRHHIYWTERYWLQLAEDQTSSADRQTVLNFRNSAPQITLVPPLLHWWIEQSQIPPPPPDMDVMRHRNEAWRVANQLLKSSEKLDEAREKYVTEGNIVRYMPTLFHGLTNTRRITPQLFVERTDAEHLLSELNSRLRGWNFLASLVDRTPIEHGFIDTVRLSDVRNLRRRIVRNATLPQVHLDVIDRAA